MLVWNQWQHRLLFSFIDSNFYWIFICPYISCAVPEILFPGGGGGVRRIIVFADPPPPPLDPRMHILYIDYNTYSFNKTSAFSMKKEKRKEKKPYLNKTWYGIKNVFVILATVIFFWIRTRRPCWSLSISCTSPSKRLCPLRMPQGKAD